MKVNYDYPAKHRIRGILRKAIEKWIPDVKGAKVVCFPGAQAREITEIYDQLGIPRANVTGIERNLGVHHELQNQNLGIRLFHGEAKDFFSKKGEFDVVSLDYTQLPSLQTIGVVRRLFKGRMLANKAVVYTNFYAKRVNDFCKYNLPYVRNCKIINHGKKGMEVTRDNLNWSAHREQIGVSFKDFRSDGLTHLLLDCIEGSGMIDDVLAQNKALPAIEIGKKQGKRTTTIMMEWTIPVVEPPPFSLSEPNYFKCNQTGFRELNIGACNINAETKEPISMGYAISGVERFSYISEDGSLMFSDIMYIDRGDEHFKSFRKSVKGITEDEKSLIPRGENPREFIKNKRRIERHANLWYRKRFQKERIHSRLPKRKDITPPKISKDDAIDLLKKGKSPEYIERNYRGHTRHQLIAYESHIKRGTYQEKIEAKPHPVPPAESTDRERKERKKNPHQQSQYLISRKIYRGLPENCRLRIDYFVAETLSNLHPRRRSTIRRAFSNSNLDKLIDQSPNHTRFYAFFDDISLAIMYNGSITPGFLNTRYKIIKNAEDLDKTAIQYETTLKTSDTPKRKPRQEKARSEIKEKVRGLVAEGFDKDDIWEQYGTHFSSRREFGAVVAWASPKLVKRRKATT